MNRAIILLCVLLSLHISFIDGASGVSEQSANGNNKIAISVPKSFVPEKANSVEVTVTLSEETTAGDHIKFSLLSSAFPGHCNNGYFGMHTAKTTKTKKTKTTNRIWLLFHRPL